MVYEYAYVVAQWRDPMSQLSREQLRYMPTGLVEVQQINSSCMQLLHCTFLTWIQHVCNLLSLWFVVKVARRFEIICC